MAVDMKVLERQLLNVIDVLDKHKVVYHLEGGTLLGIVREQRLLPWDHDTDISIMRQSLPALEGALSEIKSNGWRITVREYSNENGYSKVGDTRVVKIKDKKFFIIAGDNALDMFIKTEADGFVYWTAAGNIMRVKASYYEGYDTVSWCGRDLKVPVNYRDYLTEKYGDWSIPVKEWSCDNEKTIVKERESETVST